MMTLLAVGSTTGCSHKPVEAFKTPVKAFTGSTLDFYSTKEPYGEFSNFALYEVVVDNKTWMTSEHYYQAQKYAAPELQEWVRSAPTPMDAALRGRDPKKPKRPDWEQIKEGVMERAVRDKFQRHPELRKLLLLTGNAELFEHTKNDCYWGDCGDRSGKNKLGILLENIREGARHF